jgi:YD repeat-containing protein
VQGTTTWQSYDERGQKTDVGALDFGGASYHREHYEYDEHGRVSKKWRPYEGTSSNNYTAISYDVMGRVTSEIAPFGSTSTSYDSLVTTRRHLRSPASGRGATDEVETTETDMAGRVINKTEWVGALSTTPAAGSGGSGGTAHAIVTKYVYGPFNVLTDIYENYGATNQAHFHADYDTRGRRTGVSDPDTGVLADSYDGYGQLRSHGLLSYSYDALGRMKTEYVPGTLIRPDGTSTFVWDASANGIGQLAATTSADGMAKTIYEYDVQGRKAAERFGVNGIWGVMAYEYDDNGRPWKTTYPTLGDSTYHVTFAYNDERDGSLLSIVDSDKTQLWKADARNLVSVRSDPSLTAGREWGTSMVRGITNHEDRTRAAGTPRRAMARERACRTRVRSESWREYAYAEVVEVRARQQWAVLGCRAVEGYFSPVAPERAQVPVDRSAWT